jgi:hypothetical protein
MKYDYLYAWKEGKHFKLFLLPNGKKSSIECIKKNKIQNRLNTLKNSGWQILIKKPNFG